MCAQGQMLKLVTAAISVKAKGQKGVILRWTDDGLSPPICFRDRGGLSSSLGKPEPRRQEIDRVHACLEAFPPGPQERKWLQGEGLAAARAAPCWVLPGDLQPETFPSETHCSKRGKLTVSWLVRGRRARCAYCLLT